MTGTSASLTAVAEKGSKWKVGMTCHDAILEWLQDSGYVPAGAKDSLFPMNTNVQRPDVYKDVLVKADDTRVHKWHLTSSLAGIVIGFYHSQEGLKHSMVTLGGGTIAGVNNGSVLAADREWKVDNYMYLKMDAAHLSWQQDYTVGPNQYEVRVATADVVARRITARMG